MSSKGKFFFAVVILVIVLSLTVFLNLSSQTPQLDRDILPQRNLEGLSTDLPVIYNFQGTPVSAVRLLRSQYSVVQDRESLYAISKDEASYVIYYDQDDKSVLIMLQDARQLAQSRVEALRFLQETLLVDANSLCNLDIQVFTTSSVNHDYAGFDLGLPNCPGSFVIP